jgi:hypothetical protein
LLKNEPVASAAALCRGYRDWVTGYRNEDIVKKKINAI